MNDKDITLEILGFEERKETTSVCCIKSYINKNTMQIIYFDYDKTIDIGESIITLDLLQAIYNKCEELGWLDD